MNKSVSRSGPRRCLLALVFGGLAALTAHASVVSFAKVKTTVDNTLTANPAGVALDYVVLCSVGPLTVQTGDVISTHSQAEITFSGTQNILTGSGIIIASDSLAVNATSPSFIDWAAPNTGSNLDPAQERSTEIHQRTGSWKAPAASSSIYVNYVAHTASLDTGTHTLTVPADYAELTVVQERGVTWMAYPASQPMHITSLPIDAPNLHLQYTVGPVQVPDNTMVDVRFQIQATSSAASSDDHQNLGRTVVYATSATATTGTAITRQSSQSITHFEEHHHSASHVGGLFFGTGAGTATAYFNSALYASGSDSTPFAIDYDGVNYGHFQVELRPSVANKFFQATAAGTTSIGGTTPVVLYSVGPMTLAKNDVVEVRYMAQLGQPSVSTSLDCELIRAGSPTATSGGILVQRPLKRWIPSAYTYDQLIDSTAEQVPAAASNQYYNLVVWLPSGGTVPVLNFGELEAVIR